MTTFLKYQALFFVLTMLTLPTIEARAALKNNCRTDINVETTCQHCAKLTKSHIVYPMCCSNDELVHTWCLEYLAYGQHE